ncbi:TetR/AcrR family transcriptional regulator [Gordonia sp. CPCC 206044]|uniref:TetR/AcrR family transcriptional regulator n=1 Tax=Gordonia sp. CPCC 206044 TaxID=3140793 RepID=UPI003AF37A01
MSEPVITYSAPVGRWPTGSRERLQQTALALFVERGYEQTSVADIASRSGVTERTFYRHFGEKREVLFDGGHLLESSIVEHLADCPPDVPPLDSVIRALQTTTDEFFADRRPFSRTRQSVIDANPELQERELLKMASLTDAIADGLRGRGADDTAARLAAETGVAIFKVSFAHWVGEAADQELSAVIGRRLADLRAMTATD